VAAGELFWPLHLPNVVDLSLTANPRIRAVGVRSDRRT